MDSNLRHKRILRSLQLNENAGKVEVDKDAVLTVD
jgi:hypothetical protein